VDLPRRRWVLAPISAPAEGGATVHMRATTPDDDRRLAELLDVAYAGTIDDDPDHDHHGELETWREIDGADDGASFVAGPAAGPFHAACLLGRDLGAPFLYEIVTHPAHRRSGLARLLLGRSLRVLQARDEPLLAGWVTDGNLASEGLLGGLGFVPVTPPVVEALGVGFYRAAAATRRVELPATAVLAATSTAVGPTLWIVDRPGPSTQVEVAGSSVRVCRIGVDDDQVGVLAETAMPIRGAAWLLGQRRTGGPPLESTSELAVPGLGERVEAVGDDADGHE
jgi:GNAT superfamily N-acetyltransferase